MGFPRQEYQSKLPFPSPGDLPDPGIKPTSPALAGDFFAAEPLAASISAVSKQNHRSLSQTFFSAYLDMPHFSCPLGFWGVLAELSHMSQFLDEFIFLCYGIAFVILCLNHSADLTSLRVFLLLTMTAIGCSSSVGWGSSGGDFLHYFYTIEVFSFQQDCHKKQCLHLSMHYTPYGLMRTISCKDFYRPIGLLTIIAPICFAKSGWKLEVCLWLFSICNASNSAYTHVHMFSCVGLFVTPWTVACQASSSIHEIVQARIV